MISKNLQSLGLQPRIAFFFSIPRTILIVGQTNFENKLPYISDFLFQTHYYQPGWTLVGGGMKTFEDTGKPMKKVLPKKAEWLKTSVEKFDPDNSKVTTTEGDEISYEYLVIAMGLQLKYEMVILMVN